MKLPTTPITSLTPVSPTATLPEPRAFNQPNCPDIIKNAVTIKHTPITSWIFFSGSLFTILAPTSAPTIAAAIIENKVIPSTLTPVKNKKASINTGTVCATFNVPGIFLSVSKNLNTLNNNVVGAKLPIPNVSKKSVTNPMKNPRTGFSFPKSSLCLTTSITNETKKNTPPAPNITNNTVNKFILSTLLS